VEVEDERRLALGLLRRREDESRALRAVHQPGARRRLKGLGEQEEGGESTVIGTSLGSVRDRGSRALDSAPAHRRLQESGNVPPKPAPRVIKYFQKPSGLSFSMT
jgi:hypothetical protein